MKENNYPLEPTGIVPRRLKCWYKKLNTTDKAVVIALSLITIITSIGSYLLEI